MTITPRPSQDARTSGPGSWPAGVLLTDGTIATIRPLAPTDADALTRMTEEISDASLRFRFFGSSRPAARLYLQHLLSPEAPPTLVATHADHVIGMATAEIIDERSAEIAFLVAERWHGLGVGSLLLEHLAALGRSAGIDRFVAEVLTDNYPMLKVFTDAGFTITTSSRSGVADLEMQTVASAGFLRAADEREFFSEKHSLRPLLHPRSVAVYGAKRDGSGVGGAILRSIISGRFSGPVHVVHPAAASIAGAPATRSLRDVGVPVDLAVVAVPAERVLDALQDVVDAGTRAAVVVSSGFEELGPEGADLQRRMLTLARSHDLRIAGPNCLGLIVNDGVVHLDATFGPQVPPAGSLAVASQSGGVGIVLTDLARTRGLGIHTFVSLGNKCDVSGNDLLAAWADDPQIRAAALYLESFGNAAKFARFARRFGERKPLLAVVGGRSSGGRRAGASHTAAAASPRVGVDALFAQAGVIPCTGAEDLAETALLLTEQPLPAGRRVAILSNAGGMGVLAADDAEEAGLDVPALSAELRTRIADSVLGTTGTTNPIDTGAAATPDQFAMIADHLLGSDEIDALVVILVATGVSDASAAGRALGEVRGRHPDKPVVVVPMGGLRLDHEDIRGMTVQPTVDGSMRALARAARYAAWRADPRDDEEPRDVVVAATSRALAVTLLDEAPTDSGWLGATETTALLGPYGLAPAGRIAGNRAEVLSAAEEVGYPIAVKVADGSVVHKTERGLVRVGIVDRAALEQVLDAFEVELGSVDTPLLVQAITTGTEVALGVLRDPAFGPLVMVGAGGVATDLWNDRVFLIPPITRRDAARTLRTLRTWPLLAGFRGAPGVDTSTLEELIVRLGHLVEDVVEISEMDLNPVMVSTDGCHLVDVKVRLSTAGSIDAGVPRRLRTP